MNAQEVSLRPGVKPAEAWTGFGFAWNGRVSMDSSYVVWVFLAALVTAVATGVGALPFFFTREIAAHWLGVAGALASGIMLAASFSLLYAGLQSHIALSLVGVVLGMVLVAAVDRLLARYSALVPGGGQFTNQTDWRQMLLIVVVMTVHSIAEGVGIGVSFGKLESTLGLVTTIAIAVHNIPEGLAISLVLVPKGVSPWKAAGWSIVSSLPQPLLAVPAFLFVLAFKTFFPVGMGLAAGAMIWMIFAELLTDAFDVLEKNRVGILVVIAFTAMLVFQYLIMPAPF